MTTTLRHRKKKMDGWMDKDLTTEGESKAKAKQQERGYERKRRGQNSTGQERSFAGTEEKRRRSSAGV
jgi:hypothetical protein